MTALVIIITGFSGVQGIEGAQLTSQAFGSVISWFPYVLVIAIFLFAFSTMISWSYYGLKSWTYLFGNSKKIRDYIQVNILNLYYHWFFSKSRSSH